MLLAEYEEIRLTKLAGWPLQPPMIVASHELARTLGHWDRATRTIAIAHWLIDPRRWSLLVETLAHEVAHQAADELFDGARETAHGPSFRRACALIGVDPAATCEVARPVHLGEAESDVVRRIRKLLALASSDNRHEAEAALAKAQALALKHNVALALAASGGTPTDYEYRIALEPRKRIPSYVWNITWIIRRHYFTKVIKSHFEDRAGLLGGGRFQTIELFGTADNLDLALYVFHYLLEQGEREWERHARGGPGKTRRKISFLSGLYDGFCEKLDRERAAAEAALDARSLALIRREDPRFDDFLRERFPHLRRSGRSRMIDTDTYGKGVEAGRELQLRPAMTQRSGGGPAGLLGDGS